MGRRASHIHRLAASCADEVSTRAVVSLLPLRQCQTTGPLHTCTCSSHALRRTRASVRLYSPSPCSSSSRSCSILLRRWASPTIASQTKMLVPSVDCAQQCLACDKPRSCPNVHLYCSCGMPAKAISRHWLASTSRRVRSMMLTCAHLEANPTAMGERSGSFSTGGLRFLTSNPAAGHCPSLTLASTPV